MITNQPSRHSPNSSVNRTDQKLRTPGSATLNIHFGENYPSGSYREPTIATGKTVPFPEIDSDTAFQIKSKPLQIKAA